MARLITLTTDFGQSDSYAGILRGVIAGIAPDAVCVDLTHAIPPQDVRRAAYVLWTALPYFPADSVHVVVVDPGVGTERRALAARTRWGTLVGPDNGVFSYVWTEAPPSAVVELVNPVYRRAAVSSTFHGRDIFAPAAAYLAAGVALDELGPPVADPVRLPAPALRVGLQSIDGEVIAIDHFGNAITSIGRLRWISSAELVLEPAFGGEGLRTVTAHRVRVWVAGREAGAIRRTYGEAERGAALALVGSEGLLEIAVAMGSTVENLGLDVGDPVQCIIH